MENGPAGQAILGQTDGAMIADADWPASHSHPRISVWTVTSKTCPKPASYYQRPLAVSKNTHTKESAAQNGRFTGRFMAVAF